MSRFRTTIGGLSVLALGLMGLVTAGPAAASHVGCGATIVASTTLDSDVGPCTTDGLLITASNVTVDLGGHRVFSVNARGDIVGVRLLGVSGVTLRNGTVEGFNGGVAIFGGSGNTVERINATNNVSDYAGGTGPNCDAGDGIALFDSSNNVIRGNIATHNGPYGGISIVNNSDGNQVIGNQASYNDIASPTGTAHPTCIDAEQQDEGIRIEGPGADNNVVQGNNVTYNLLAGIALHGAAAPTPANTNNTITRNSVHFNGNDSTDNNASGISLLSTGPSARAYGTTITNNVSSDNAADGIFVPAGSHDNLLQGNLVERNRKDGIFLAGPTFGNQFTNVGPSLLQVTSPAQPPYAASDYRVLSGSGSGDVTARLVPVGNLLFGPAGTIPFDTATSGCSPADFVGFPVGAVALVQRGFCGRGTKVDNAARAGASAVIMFNEGSTGRTGVLTLGVNVTTIPVVGVSYATGQALYNLTQAGPVIVHVVTNTTNVRVQTGPGAENNRVLQNRGQANTEHDGHDNNLAPPCDNNQWSGNTFGTVNQACVATGGSGTVTP